MALPRSTGSIPGTREWVGLPLHESAPGPAGSVPGTRDGAGPTLGKPALPRGLESCREVVVFGFGDGGLLGEVLRRVSPAARVTVAVLDPGAFVEALRRRDLRAVLADPRLVLAVGGVREIARCLPRRPGESLRVVVAPTVPGEVPEALAPLAGMARELAAAQSSLLGQRPVVLANVAANLEVIAGAEPVAVLLPVFAGRPTLLVAPGPSLAGDLPWLRAHRDELPVLVALDASLRALRGAGIRPDLVVTLDPSPRNTHKFRSEEGPAPGADDGRARPDVAPRNLLPPGPNPPGTGPAPARWLHRDLPVVFFEGARPEVVAAAGRPLFACERGGLLDRAHPAFGRAGTYRSGGTVLLAALDVLLQLGAGPVGLLGADLALGPGGAYGTGGERPGGEKGRVLEVPGRDGEMVRTTETLWRHRRRLLRRIAAEEPGRVVDLSGKGADLPGVPRADLRSWVRHAGKLAGGRRAPVPWRRPPGAVSLLAGPEREEALAAARAALLAAGAAAAGPVLP